METWIDRLHPILTLSDRDSSEVLIGVRLVFTHELPSLRIELLLRNVDELNHVSLELSVCNGVMPEIDSPVDDCSLLPFFDDLVFRVEH